MSGSNRQALLQLFVSVVTKFLTYSGCIRNYKIAVMVVCNEKQNADNLLSDLDKDLQTHIQIHTYVHINT